METEQATALIDVIISRATWLRGEGGVKSRLLRPTDGKMCCLGFAAKTLGATDADINNKTTLWDTRWLDGEPIDNGLHYPIILPMGGNKEEFAANGHEFKARRALSGMYVENDRVDVIDGRQREESLTRLAREVGFNFIFVDSIPNETQHTS